MIKIALLAAVTGHILCGVSDCLLSYSNMIPLAPTKLPAKGNIAGAMMYFGLLMLM